VSTQMTRVPARERVIELIILREALRDKNNFVFCYRPCYRNCQIVGLPPVVARPIATAPICRSTRRRAR